MDPSMQQRLQQLKQMSIALKKQSAKSEDSTVILIKSILKMSQSSKNTFRSIRDDAAQPLLLSRKLYDTKHQQNFMDKNYKQSQFQDIISIQQQNKQLKKRLIQTQGQLHQQKKKLQMTKGQIFKIYENPYYQMEETLNIFCTNKAKYQYQQHKIDYEQKYVVLQYEKLAIVQANKEPKLFNLVDLRQVSYHHKNTICLLFEFQSNETYNIFIQFKSQDQARKWDLAIYVNWNIVNFQKRINLFHSIDFESLNNPQELKKNHRYLNAALKREFKIYKLQDIQIQPTDKKNQMSQNLNFQDFSSNFQLLSPTKRVKMTPQRIMQRKKAKAALEKLKNGYQMNKYSKNGWFIHLKRVYIDEEKRLLCLEDVKNKSDVKKHPINMIENIQYMQFGEGVKKFQQKPKPNNFVLIQLKTRILQLGIDNPSLIYEFTNNLRDVWSYYSSN